MSHLNVFLNVKFCAQAKRLEDVKGSKDYLIKLQGCAALMCLDDCTNMLQYNIAVCFTVPRDEHRNI